VTRKARSNYALLERASGLPQKGQKNSNMNSLLHYIPPLPMAGMKFSNDPKYSEKPLNKGPKFLFRQMAKSRNDSE
jgi:hypothetical protein